MFKVSKILVPVDLSSCSRAALSNALALATDLGAKVDVLYVAELPQFKTEPRVVQGQGGTTLRDYALDSARGELEAFLSELPVDQRQRITSSVETGGRARDAILESAKRGSYDLIVMGTHGRTGRVLSLAGSVAESVVRLSSCPVLTVREPS